MSSFTFSVSNYRCFGENNPLTFTLGPGFTAFVGPNDAGKSTALRFFSELRVLWHHVTTAPALAARVNNPQQIESPRHVTDAMDIFNDRNALPIRILISLDDAPADGVTQVEISLSRSLQATFNVRGAATSTTDAGVGVSHAPGKIVLQSDALDYTEYEWLFDALASPLYIPAFRNAINSGSGNYLDLTVGTAFVASWDAWKNGSNKLQRDAMVEVEDNVRRLLGYGSLAINASPDKKELRVVVDGRSRNLAEMGSGVAEFLLIIGNLFINRPKVILIDEPETHLHPSKQLELLRLLLATSGAGILLFATHALGLARSVTRNIAQIQRDTSGASTSTAFLAQPTLQEFLGEMNYTAQRELGAGTVFFVEGVTDVIAVRHFLRLYGKDHDFVILPLLGDCLINGRRNQELRELARLAVPCVALLDSERTSAGDPLAKNRLDFLNIWHGLGFKSHVLERRALENYFTDAAVKATTPSANALGAFDKPAKKDKDRNGAVALHMSKHDLDSTDLGQFLASL